MPANWSAVGNAITDRLDARGMPQKVLAARSGVSVATIREIQRGKERRRDPSKLRKISVALGWPASYLQNILEGRQQPDQQAHEAEAPLGDPAAFLTKLAFVLEHRIGRVVDVIYHDDSAVDITIEIRRSPREQ